ncbi:hypothetical protein ACET8F_02110 [Aeromonas veronii]
MEDDLTWLARTEHRWPKDAVYVSRHENAVEWHYVELSFIGYGYFTRDQWLARRAELQNKPSWADAPEWAQWLGQIESGNWEWYGGEESPSVHESGDCWLHKAGGKPSGVGGEVLGDWRDTLERRPVDLSEPAVTARLTEATENVLAAAPALMDEKFRIDRSDWFDRGELPPVGIECEVLWDDCEWHKTKIIAHLYIDKFNMCPVFTTSWDDTSFVECMPHYQSFRPLRTEREKAIEEMKRHCPHHGSWDTVGRIYAEAIYDAGYRKQSLPAD